MRSSIELNLDDAKELSLIAKALSVETRIEMMRLLCMEEQSVNDLAKKMNIPASSAAAHIKILEEAGLIRTTRLPASRGSKKVSNLVFRDIAINLDTELKAREKIEIIRMPIGNYVDYEVWPTCGMVNEKEPIGQEDEPRCFYHPARTTAKLLWFGKGYVEYRFPNDSLTNNTEKQLELSAELCSEDHEYNMDYPSDITVWINGYEAGTWKCKSDYGGRRGKLNPTWWPDKNTQYGELKTWKLTKQGTYIDDEKVSDRTIEEYALSKNEFISVRFGIKDDAKNIGGINLFGENFGDHAQNILMKIIF